MQDVVDWLHGQKTHSLTILRLLPPAALLKPSAATRRARAVLPVWMWISLHVCNGQQRALM